MADNPPKDNVVTPSAFQRNTEGDTSGLQDAGTEYLGTLGYGNIPDSELELVHPIANEEVIGELLPEEVVLFKTMYGLGEKFSEASMQVSGDTLISMGEAIKAGKTPSPSSPLQPEMSEEQAVKFFSLQRDFELAKALLWAVVSNRFGCPDWTLGVRTRFRVIKVKRNW